MTRTLPLISYSLLAVLFVFAGWMMPEQAAAQQTPLEKLLRRLDTGRDGDLDPNEMVGRTREWVEGLGFDPNTYHDIDVLLEAYRNKGNVVSGGPTLRKVPGFGNGNDGDAVDTPGFGANSSFVELSYEELNEQYGEELLGRAVRILENNDRDGNGSLGPVEIENATWGNPMPFESDLNSDGSLSITELVMRFHLIEKATRGSMGTFRNRDRGDEDRDEGNESGRGRRRQAAFTANPQQAPQVRVTTESPAAPPAQNQSAPSQRMQDHNRYQEYVNEVLSKYDTNGDGMIDAEEQGEMRRVPAGADKDEDGNLSRQELYLHYSGGETGGGGQPAQAGERISGSRRPSGRSRSSSRRSGSFSDLDINQDGQIQMSEFAPADDWNGDVFRDFQAKDFNGDGVITSQEWNGR
ncbi:MAG: hypothetical protein AAF456_11295 [Planctomycetota bacterium]